MILLLIAVSLRPSSAYELDASIEPNNRIPIRTDSAHRRTMRLRVPCTGRRRSRGPFLVRMRTVVCIATRHGDYRFRQYLCSGAFRRVGRLSSPVAGSGG